MSDGGAGAGGRNAEQRPGFRRLLRTVQTDLGFQTDSYNDAYLRRRIDARMRRCSVEGYDAYARLLGTDDGEREELLDTLSVNVTSFFRNPEVWAELGPVLREVSAGRGRVRIWSAAASDGREAYSMAMLAHLDPEVDESRVGVVGTDIDREILTKARRGRYRRSETDDPLEQLSAIEGARDLVTVTDDHVTVNERVRDLVSFRHHDLVTDDPVGTGEFDLVICRNLFIYIREAAKANMVATLNQGLRAGGYLVIGLTETLPADARGDFEAFDRRRRLYRKHG
jgi:chemotaxis protein methyltransferase CheR